MFKNTNNAADREKSTQDGFTLIEVLIASTVSIIVLFAMMTVFTTTQRHSLQQVEVSMLQQNQRGILNILERELRMIGMDMRQANTFSVVDIRSFNITQPGTSATPDATPTGHPILQFTLDLNDDGIVNANETITYLLYDRDGDPSNGFDLGRTTTTAAGANAIQGRQLLAEGIQEIGFAYAFDADDDGDIERTVLNPGDPPSVIWAVDTDNDGLLDADLGGNALANGVMPQQIRVVQIWILGRTQRRDIKHFDQQIYNVGNRVVDPQDPAIATTNFRHWLLSEIIHLRNL